MDVLLYIDEDGASGIRMRHAVALVETCGGFLHCLQATSPFALIASGSFGTARMLAERAEEAERRKQALAADTRARLAGTDIGWDYAAYDGDIVQCVVEQSRLVDLIVFSTEPQPSRLNNETPSAGEVLPRVRVPVLAVPNGDADFSPAGPALVAWDGSPQCAFALRNALPVLRWASSILIVTVDTEKTEIGADRARAYLAHHELGAETRLLPAEGRPISAVLVDAVREQGSAYVVMGAYGRGRARELLLGGVTRDMLKKSPVPLLLTH